MDTERSSESDADNRLLGECECGAVRYRVADAFLYAMNCHCSRCRAATGSAFKAFAGIEREKLEITDGRDRVLVFGEEDSNHTRCAACGSLLFSVVREGAYVHVAMGSLVDAPVPHPTKHCRDFPGRQPRRWPAGRASSEVANSRACPRMPASPRRSRA